MISSAGVDSDVGRTLLFGVFKSFCFGIKLLICSLSPIDSSFFFWLCFLSFEESVGPAIALRSLCINSVGVCPLSGFSDGVWMLLLSKGFRNPKPPWIFLSFNVMPMVFNCFILSSSIWGVDVHETTSSHLRSIGFLSNLKNKHLIKWDNFIVGTSDRLRFCEWWCLFTANSSSLELPASVYSLQWKQSWGRRLFIILCVWIGISRIKERAKVSFFVLLPSQRYHYVVYCISELQIDTLSSKRFAKIKFSHVMLYSNRLREKSNLKLENSSSSERKASSNSTVFFLVYGTYNCVCKLFVLLYNIFVTITVIMV